MLTPLSEEGLRRDVSWRGCVSPHIVCGKLGNGDTGAVGFDWRRERLSAKFVTWQRSIVTPVLWPMRCVVWLEGMHNL